MYNFTLFGGKVKPTKSFLNLTNSFQKLLKSITGFAVVMLFLLSANTLQAQEVPCIDGNTIDWGLPSITGHPNYSYVEDPISDADHDGNMDDAYHTDAKDIHDFGVGGNNWTITSTLPKGDIMNASALVAVAGPQDPGDACGALTYIENHTYLFFAGDRRQSNGTAFMGFWFLVGGSSPTTVMGDDIFMPAHDDDDLLVLANFSKGAKLADVLIYRWDGGALTDITGSVTGVAAQNNEMGTIDVPTPWEGNVKTGQTDYDQYEFYEGVIDLTTVFDLVADPFLLCNASWMLETRSSDQLTAKLKDYAAGSFNLEPNVVVSDDTVCTGGSATLTAQVFYQGVEQNAGDFSYVWKDPSDNPIGIDSHILTVDPALVAGAYTVTVTDNVNGCNPSEPGTGNIFLYPVTPDDTASGNVCEGDLFTYEGNDYAPGSYDIPRVDGNGCPWKTVLTVTQYPTTPDDTASGNVCEGDLFTYEGNDYAPGSYDIPRVDGNGCPWKTVLTVTQYPTTPDDTASGNVCEGDLFTYEGNDYAPGSYDIPRVDGNGCPWKTVLTVTQYPTTPDDTASGNVCEGDLFTYEGNDYAPGSYDIPRVDGNGCPWKTVLTVTQYPTTPDDTASGNVCEGDLFTYEGNDYAPGSYDIPRVDGNGCPWKTVLTVTQYPTTPDDTASGNVCEGDLFTYEGNDYAPGSYDIPRVDGNGCPWKTVLTVTQYPTTPDDTASGNVCEGDLFTYEGNDYAPGSYDIPRVDGNGCPWKTVLTVTQYPTTPDDTASGNVCEGDLFTYEGNDYAPGSYDIPRVDGNGCPWKTVLTVTQYPTTPDDTASGNVCEGDLFTYEGNDYAPGSYDIPRVDGNGCPWKTVLTVTQYPTTPDDTASGNVCEGDLFTYEGNDYAPGSYDIPRVDGNGCPWKTVLTVTQYPTTPDDTASGNVCEGDLFTYEGNDYAPGSYDIPRVDGNGCPWKTVLTVTQYPTTPDDTASGEVCVGDLFTYEGNDYAPGSYDIPRVDGNGCPWKTVLTVTENPLPICSASNSTELCVPCLQQNPVIDLMETGGEATAWSWSSNGSAMISNGNTANASATGAVDGEIFTVMITDANGCTSSCTTTVTIVECIEDCGTAFGVFTTGGDDPEVEGASECFRESEHGFRRWGWTNEITAGGTYILDLYQGAGKCDLDKGTLVGTATIDYVYDDYVQVTYNMLPGYGVSEAHIYVGCDPYPTGNSGNYTVAPGQYTYNSGGDLEFASTNMTPEIDASGTIYVIVHAVACASNVPDNGCAFIPVSRFEGDVLEGNTTCDCKADSSDFRSVDFTAYPVPFDKEVNIKYSFDYDTDVRIDVYDIKGTLIKSDINNNYVRGTQDKSTIDLSQAANQLFFVKLTTSQGTMTKKIVSSSLKR